MPETLSSSEVSLSPCPLPICVGGEEEEDRPVELASTAPGFTPTEEELLRRSG